MRANVWNIDMKAKA